MNIFVVKSFEDEVSKLLGVEPAESSRLPRNHAMRVVLWALVRRKNATLPRAGGVKAPRLQQKATSLIDNIELATIACTTFTLQI